MTPLLLLVLQLVAPSLCGHGPKQIANWADYPQIVYADDVNDHESYLGVWIARNWVLAPDGLMSFTLDNIDLQSGDVLNNPKHHPILKEIEIEDDSDYWSLEPSAFADQSKNHTGLHLYAKYPSKVLASRAVNVLSYEAAKATFRSLSNFGTDHIDPYDPSDGSCSHVIEAVTNDYNVYPFLMVNGQVEGWMSHDHCTSTGRKENGPTCFASTAFSAAAIKAGAGL